MSEYISIHCNKNTYVSKLIAFFPNEGYIIFEGYTNIKKDNLPYTIIISRLHPGISDTGLFEANVLEVGIKKLPHLKTESKSDYYDEDYECNIVLFSSYIVILKIEILDKKLDDKYPNVDWSFCIDDRFPTNSILIDNYLKLANVNDEGNYENNKDNNYDDFYNGYYNIIEKNIDIYDSQYNEMRKDKLYQGLVNGAKKIPRPPSKTILPIIEKWQQLFNNANRSISSDFGNKEFLKSCIKFFDYIEEQIPFLSKWCAEYVCDLPFQDKLRGWLTYAIKNVNETNTPKHFEKYWKLFFRKENDEPDIVTLDSIDFDISYKHYLVLIDKMKKEKNYNNCDVPEILDLHKDIECNDGFGCCHCEDQEERWHVIVSKKYKSMNNIFINRKLADIFIEKWLEAVLNLKDTEQEKINFIWPPLRFYKFRESLYSFNKESNLYEYDQFISELIKKRDRTYHGYYFRPKVEFEFIGDLQNSLYDYSIDSIYPFKESPNQFNEIYLAISHILSYISYMMYIDRKRCNELIEIFDKLLDE